MEWIGLIGAAVIGGPVMYLLHRLERRNTEQHLQAQHGRTRIVETLDAHGRKLDSITETLLVHVTDSDAHR